MSVDSLKENTPPKVFVSYSWSSIEHRDRVRRYAERLRENHVDVIMDIWDLKPGQDKNVFMEQMVGDPSVTHVLVFIDKQYTVKANARKDGVGTESQIISQQLYKSVDQTKFIPIFCEKDDNGKLSAPIFFEPRIGYDFSSPSAENDNWEPLIRFLHGKPRYIKPAMGPMPTFLDEKNAPPVLPTTNIFERFKKACKETELGPDLLSRDYFNLSMSYLETYRVHVCPDRDALETFDETVQAQLQNLIPFRNQFIDWLDVFVSFQTDDNTLANKIRSMIPVFASLLGRPDDLASWHDGVGLFDTVEVTIYEFILYLIAILLKQCRDNVVHDILMHRYYMRNHTPFGQARMEFCGLGIFACDACSFYNRNRRLSLNRLDLLADWVKEHTYNNIVSFENLMEADGVIYLGGLLASSVIGDWYPRTYVYSQRGLRQIPLFDAARDKEYADRLRVLFGYKDIDELKAKVLSIFKDQAQICHTYGDVRNAFQYAVNVKDWATI